MGIRSERSVKKRSLPTHINYDLPTEHVHSLLRPWHEPFCANLHIHEFEQPLCVNLYAEAIFSNEIQAEVDGVEIVTCNGRTAS